MVLRVPETVPLRSLRSHGGNPFIDRKDTVLSRPVARKCFAKEGSIMIEDRTNTRIFPSVDAWVSFVEGSLMT